MAYRAHRRRKMAAASSSPATMRAQRISMRSTASAAQFASSMSRSDMGRIVVFFARAEMATDGKPA
jgi:hypothetical protein